MAAEESERARLEDRRKERRLEGKWVLAEEEEEEEGEELVSKEEG